MPDRGVRPTTVGTWSLSRYPTPSSSRTGCTPTEDDGLSCRRSRPREPADCRWGTATRMTLWLSLMVYVGPVRDDWYLTAVALLVPSLASARSRGQPVQSCVRHPAKVIPIACSLALLGGSAAVRVQDHLGRATGGGRSSCLAVRRASTETRCVGVAWPRRPLGLIRRLRGRGPRESSRPAGRWATVGKAPRHGGGAAT